MVILSEVKVIVEDISFIVTLSLVGWGGLEYTECIPCKELGLFKEGVFWVRHLTISGSEALVQEICGVWSTSSLPLLPDPL